MAVRYLKTETGYAPRLYCDQCGNAITEASEAIAVSAGRLEAVGETVPCAYLHKGDCDDAWQARHPPAFDTGSDELNVHLAFLVQNLGLPISAAAREAWRIPPPFDFE
jgi:hypothetical protein